MSSSIATAGRSAALTPSPRIIARNWWPVAFWIGVIRLESTDFASSGNTGMWLYSFLSHLFPGISFIFVFQLNEALRKCGHFGGYAILSALVFLALRNTYRDRMRPLLQRDWGIHLHDYWRWEWMLLGMMVTILTASFDEIHQTFIPSRTGRWQDVVIDSSGAFAIQVVLYIYSWWAVGRSRAKQVEVTA